MGGIRRSFTAVIAGLMTTSGAAIASADPGVSPVSDVAHAGGFVMYGPRCPTRRHLRYATTNNFTHTQLIPRRPMPVYQSMAPGLAAAAGVLRPQGHLLVFWDCDPPHTNRSRCSTWSNWPGLRVRVSTRTATSPDGRSIDIHQPQQEARPNGR